MELQEKINYEQFSKIKMKVGRIIGIEDIQGKDKLYLLKVDIAESEPRILFAGIKQHYTKEQLKNKFVIVVANLEPKKMGNIASNGMLLAAVTEVDGKEHIALAVPDKEIAVGSDVM